jgi:uncharacterized cofD-like protein
MKGFFGWFKNSNKMKRWMLLVIVGIVLATFAMAKILVLDEISNMKQIAEIVASFIFGFTFIILGLVFLNKRTLEILVESTDDRISKNKKVNMKSLIFDKTIYDKGPNIVVIGGGAGLNTVLSGMKKYTNNITAIVTVSDYGREKSNSRKELQILPVDDIKDSIVSLARKDGAMKDVFNYVFTKGKLRGLSFADIYFLAMNEVNRDFSDSIMSSSEVLDIVGKVIPVTLDEMKICAELENGYVVEEKDRIPEVVADKFTKISRMFISPTNCKPAPGVLEAIREADSIIIGPGSLYTNVIPNLLVNGVAKAIKESKAIKIYVSNIMTEFGQTDEYTVADHINAIVEHCGEGLIDYCIYDTGEIVPEYIKMYNKEGSELVEQKFDGLKDKTIKFLKRNISMISDGKIRHDANLVAASVIELICDDLKFKDMQNDPEFIMMNTKLKEDKKLNKKRKATERAMKKNKNSGKERKTGRKSKFSSKYSERIKSIQESDAKTKRKKSEVVENKKISKQTRKKANNMPTERVENGVEFIDESNDPFKQANRNYEALRERMLEELQKSKFGKK